MINNFRANATNATRPGFREANRLYQAFNGLTLARNEARAA
jgi:hypothetical protein